MIKTVLMLGVAVLLGLTALGAARARDWRALGLFTAAAVLIAVLALT